MKKLTLNSNAFDKGEVLTRTQLKKVMGGTGSDIGTPGGDNGNPCADGGCEAAGGTLMAQYASGTVLLGNCNDYPAGSECHNACFMVSGPNFWC